MTTSQSTNPADDDSLLQHCPRCGYCIRGLPTEHKCPECGFLFDRRWRVFGGRFMRSRVTSRIFWRRLRLLLPAAVSIVGLTLLLMSPRRRAVSGGEVAILLVVASAGIVYRAVKYRRGGFILLDANGVTIYRDNRQSHCPWDSLGQARLLRPDQRLELICAGERVLIPTRPIFGLDFEEAMHCAAAINAHPRPGATK